MTDSFVQEYAKAVRGFGFGLLSGPIRLIATTRALLYWQHKVLSDPQLWWCILFNVLLTALVVTPFVRRHPIVATLVLIGSFASALLISALILFATYLGPPSP